MVISIIDANSLKHHTAFLCIKSLTSCMSTGEAADITRSTIVHGSLGYVGLPLSSAN
jgi:hypothetical protein